MDEKIDIKDTTLLNSPVINGGKGTISIYYGNSRDTEPTSSYVIECAKEISGVFVKTSPFKTAIAALNSKNMIVLVGDSGIGKTTTSFMLANNFAHTYEITLIEGVNTQGDDNINRVIEALKNNMRKNEIIVFDDFLGKTRLNESETYLLAIEELLKTMKNCSSKKLILNSRKTIMESAKKLKKSLADFLKFDIPMLDFTDGYNFEDRIKIFQSYILKNAIDNSLDALLTDNKTLNAIIKHANFNPLIIDRATIDCKSKTPEQFGETILALLDNPQFLWEKEVNALDDNSLNYLFVLYSISDKFIHKNIVDDCYKSFIKKNGIKQTESLEDTVMCLTALVSYDKQGKITFRHPSLIDYLSKKIYDQKDELLSAAIYFEQIEKIDVDKEKINELLSSPEIFFGFRVLPIVYSNQSIELPNSICVKYLKYIFDLVIPNKEYEDAIIMALDHIFEYGRMLLITSSDVIINILSIKYYDLSVILANEEFMKLLYSCSNSINMWKLIEITVKKDEQGFDFLKMKPYVQNEILDKLGEIASNETESLIKCEFEQYMLDNIDDYSEYYDYYDIAQDIISIIIDDLDLIESGENSMIDSEQEHRLYNVDLSKIEYELYDYENLIDDFAISKIDDYITNR